MSDRAVLSETFGGLYMLREFKSFLLKENILALAIAVVMGGAIGKLVQAVVDDFIMPIVGAALPAGEWQKATLDVGPVKFLVGDFASVLLNFLIIAFVIWRIAKAFIRPAAVEAPVTRPCTFCRMNIDPAATRCPHCTSQL
ncbi:MAG TPA: MscL family protein [Gemmatimonadaceae bacterium]|nr:MscL family protein [Gemmatimonadaceae bacterium]